VASLLRVRRCRPRSTPPAAPLAAVLLLAAAGTAHAATTAVADSQTDRLAGTSAENTVLSTASGGVACYPSNRGDAMDNATIDWGDASKIDSKTPACTGASGDRQLTTTHAYTTANRDAIKITCGDRVDYHFAVASAPSRPANTSPPSVPAKPNPERSLGCSTATWTGAGDTSAALAVPGSTPASPEFVSISKPALIDTNAVGILAQVIPNGLPTRAYFLYGLDGRYERFGITTYNHSTPAQQIGSDFSVHSIGARIPGLLPNALYHVLLVAVNSAGTTYSGDQTILIPKAPPPPSPKLGKTENLAPVSGIVFLLEHGQFVPLTQASQIPLGSVLDALHGSLTIAAAGAKNGQKYTGTFGGAIFRLTQMRSAADKGLTILSIVEGAFNGAPSYAGCGAKGAADAHAALSSRVLQTLKARSQGQFRTRGRYAAATAGATQWTTADRCDGTRIAVQQHSVLVNDFVKHSTVLVKAGQSYLAKVPAHK